MTGSDLDQDYFSCRIQIYISIVNDCYTPHWTLTMKDFWPYYTSWTPLFLIQQVNWITGSPLACASLFPIRNFWWKRFPLSSLTDPRYSSNDSESFGTPLQKFRRPSFLLNDFLERCDIFLMTSRAAFSSGFQNIHQFLVIVSLLWWILIWSTRMHQWF